ncbi:MAG: YggT family protein [Syntrophobacteraceae bacterium]
MFIIANFLAATAYILDKVIYAYMVIIIIRALLSWVNPDPYNPIVRFLYNVTEPVLYRVRRMVPLFAGGIDFSPMIVILALMFLDQFLPPTLMKLAYSIGM